MLAAVIFITLNASVHFAPPQQHSITLQQERDRIDASTSSSLARVLQSSQGLGNILQIPAATIN